ncbi:MAG: FprA family A-type flavoprotein [candidate division WOR-3 bacterium]|nr:FprA family A-type flavoprotein [candidate division WOR-3 bacterium]MCX7837437.1 FprA family A-type flavoprotein [candidate division WOR-3 bacterium]
MVREIMKNIFAVGVNDWDRRLFDELIPLPDGTSYNAYLIKGKEKNVLIDTVDPTKERELIKNLKSLDLKIDYLISLHAEQDHSGAIPKVLELYPEAKLITNKKGKEFLIDLLLIPEERFITVEDNEKISLGNKTLQFIFTPWVHWPETMVAYLLEDKILFTCDLFGSHLATSDLFAKDKERVYISAKRYYAEIMMPFRTLIKEHLKKIKNLEIKMIAPSHGPIYSEPDFIINAYEDWVSDKVKNEVILAYVSMHNSTKIMAEFLISELINYGIKVIPFNLTKTDIGELAIAVVDAATILIGTPTILTGPHPAALFAIYLINILKPKTKYLGIFGSYGWGGKTIDIVKNLFTNLNAEMLPPLLIKGYPKEKDFDLLKEWAKEIKEKHQNL